MKDLLAKTKEYLPQEKLSLIEEAQQFASQCHDGQVRQSGEPYLEHPMETAMLLAELRLDASSITAALLHDVTEDCGIPLSELESRFGPEVSKLVDGTTKLSKVEWQALAEKPKERKGGDSTQTQAENLRKMLVAMAEDVRVVLIKLADRLHNMRTLKALPPQRRRHIAQETMEIYAPLAHRLGILNIKWQLEDLSFRYLQPQRYREISHLLVTKRAEREKYIAQITRTLREELKKAGIKAEVTGRPKDIYSIHQKMERYAAQGKEFHQIYDLLALRILVDEVQDCYGALGVIHSLWHPIPGQFDDYIANPKDNMYHALHTSVMYMGRTPLEIQIRTHEMHRMAEYGIAAHWLYKEGTKGDVRFEERMTWLRQLLEWQREVSRAEEFLESVKTDIFPDQVFVYTPKGEVKELPAGAAPLDFAYRIHTELGNRCVGAKVNGRLVSLDYQLRDGDTVEIITSKSPRGPSRDWLNPHLGYIKTAHAREKIRQWFKRQERPENIQRGRELLEKEMKRLGISFELEEMASLFKAESLDEFLVAVGCGGISIPQVVTKLATQEERPPLPHQVAPSKERDTAGVEVLGVGDLLTHLAPCCDPLPGDGIVGFVTRSRGITIHRKDCPNILHQEEMERLVQVDWGRNEQSYPVGVCIEARDRVGLLRDITTVVSSEKINIAAASTQTGEDNTFSILLTLEITGIGQLSRLFSRLEGVRGVISATRSPQGSRE